MLRIVAPLGLDLYHYALDGANWIILANLASRIVLELISERGILEVTNMSCTRGTNRNISYVNRQEIGIDVTYVSSSRFVHPRLLLASRHPFLFPYLVLIFPRMLFAHSNSIYERFSEYLPSAAPPASRPRQMQRTRGRRLCAIVVSRLLFLGNFTSFTNYPLRAHAVRKWRCSPDIAALTEKRVTVPENGDGVGSYLAIV